jgi:hypothetical protein
MKRDHYSVGDKKTPEWLTGPLQVFDFRLSPFAGRAFRSGNSNHALTSQGCQ